MVLLAGTSIASGAGLLLLLFIVFGLWVVGISEAADELEEVEEDEDVELDEQVLLSESESEVTMLWLGRLPPVVSVSVWCRLSFVCVLFVCVSVCLWILSDLVFMSVFLATRGTMVNRWRCCWFVDISSFLLILSVVKSL